MTQDTTPRNANDHLSAEEARIVHLAVHGHPDPLDDHDLFDDTDTPAPPVAAIPAEAVEEAASATHRAIRDAVDPNERDQFIRFWTPRQGVGDPVIMCVHDIARAALAAALPHLCPSPPVAPGLAPVVTDAMVEAGAEVVYDATTTNYHAAWNDISDGEEEDDLDDTDRGTADDCRRVARDVLRIALEVAAPPPPAAPELDRFAKWFDQRANDEYGKVVVYDFGRDEDDDRVRSMAEAVTQFRASRATEGMDDRGE